MSENNGYVKRKISGGIGEIEFFHPKGNSLPGSLLYKLSEAVNELGSKEDVKVIILRSVGGGAFCAGASFDELISIDNYENGRKFFMGFANVINAMRKCPKFIIAAVHGKIVGGGVGLVAATDYSVAVKDASIRLSELALSIGPFVIGPAVERKIGSAAYSYMTVDFEWRSARWGVDKGLYSKAVDSVSEMDIEINRIARKLSVLNPETVMDLKKCFWEGTEDWDEKLMERAEMSGGWLFRNSPKSI